MTEIRIEPANTSAWFSGNTALRASAAFWLMAALIGQWAFLYYIAAFYGRSTLTGNFEVWNRLEAMGRTPYVAGDTTGNFAFSAHALGAGIIAFAGALQLISQIRKRAPGFHRWNGRIFLLTVVALSLSGFYLVWVRGTPAGLVNDLSVSFNGLLILGFAALTYRAARARRIAVHRRWAMRLYLVSNAQWFLRVGVFAYFAVSQMLGAQAGFDDPFIRLWTFGCYLAPLAVLEFYLRAKDCGSSVIKGVMAGGLVVLALLLAVGIVGFGAFTQMIISGEPLEF